MKNLVKLQEKKIVNPSMVKGVRNEPLIDQSIELLKDNPLQN